MNIFYPEVHGRSIRCTYFKDQTMVMIMTTNSTKDNTPRTMYHTVVPRNRSESSESKTKRT